MRATRATPGFKAGYTDGCTAVSAASADMSVEKFRDQSMYDSDPNYRSGWANGWTNCRSTSGPTGRNPNAGPVPDINPGGQHAGY